MFFAASVIGRGADGSIEYAIVPISASQTQKVAFIEIKEGETIGSEVRLSDGTHLRERGGKWMVVASK